MRYRISARAQLEEEDVYRDIVSIQKVSRYVAFVQEVSKQSMPLTGAFSSRCVLDERSLVRICPVGVRFGEEGTNHVMTQRTEIDSA